MKHPTMSRWDVLMERRQNVSVIRLHDLLLEHCDDVSRGCNNDFSSACLKQVSNETLNDVLVIRHQDVSVVRIYEVPVVRLYDVSFKSQTKHPITLLWYVSTTTRYRNALLVILYYVFKLLCHDFHLVGFHVS